MSEEAIELVQFPAGAVLFREGEGGFHFFIIQEGTVEVFRTLPDGSELHLGWVEEGQPLGEFAMIVRQPRSASARAKSDVVAAKINEKAYAELLSHLPEWAVSVMSALIERLRLANARMRQMGDPRVRAPDQEEPNHGDTAISWRRRVESAKKSEEAAAEDGSDTDFSRHSSEQE